MFKLLLLDSLAFIEARAGCPFPARLSLLWRWPLVSPVRNDGAGDVSEWRNSDTSTAGVEKPWADALGGHVYGIR